MKTRIAVLAALLIIGALFVPAIAITDDGKAITESYATKILMDSDSIMYGLVEIDSENTMNIWFVPKSADEDTIIKSMASAVGLYIGVCKTYPEIADLNLMAGTKATVSGKMYCKREWVDEVRAGVDGSYNSSEIGLVGVKVLGTFKQTS